MTIIAHPHIESVQGKQMTAALALAQLLKHDLPATHWGIGRFTGILRGAVDSREDVAVWAQYLRATVTSKDESDNCGDRVVLTVQGTAHGVTVKITTTIWTAVQA